MKQKFILVLTIVWVVIIGYAASLSLKQNNTTSVESLNGSSAPSKTADPQAGDSQAIQGSASGSSLQGSASSSQIQDGSSISGAEALELLQ